MNWYDTEYMKSLHPAINPSPAHVLLTHRSLLMGMLLRSGYSIAMSKSITNELLEGLRKRINKGHFPNDIAAWLMRALKKSHGSAFYVQNLSQSDGISMLYAVSHPALTPISRGLLCLHLIGGIPNNRLVPHGQSPQRWQERLARALRGLTISISSDVLALKRSYATREGVILDTLYRSMMLCDRFSFPHVRSYLTSLFHTLQPSLFHVSEGLGFAAWCSLDEACRYAKLFDSDLRHQDRNRWNQSRIQLGLRYLDEARSLSYTWGPQILRSSILALHLTASSYEETPWEDVMRLHLLLLTFDNSSEQLLAYIEALSHTKGPEYALPYLQEQETTDYRWVHAQAQILKQMGRKQDALVLFQHALHNAPDLEHDLILSDMVDL
jgi:hypothetical protein